MIDINIAWISIGNPNYGSTRIDVSQISDYINTYQGFNSVILHYNKMFNFEILGAINVLKDRIIK